MLYNLAVELNTEVVAQIDAYNREYTYLLGYFDLLLRSVLREGCKEDLRCLTQLFVNAVFRLDAAISQVRMKYFDGRNVLFSDAASKLHKLLEMADFPLDLHNSIAEQLQLPALTKESISEELETEVEYLVSLWIGIAEARMLGDFGTAADCRASIHQTMRRLRGDPVQIAI